MQLDALTSVATLLRRRFLFNALLPTLVFVTIGVAIVIDCAGSLTALAAWWVSLDVLSKVLAALAYVAAIWFLAGAVASQWGAIVRLFEGYPAIAVAKRLGQQTAPGVLCHQMLATDLRSGGPKLDPEKAYFRYPPTKHIGDVLPTRLGNVLLSAELYPYDRYGIDSVLFWARLYPLLPEQFQADYEEFVTEHEFPLVVAFQAAATTVIGGGAILAAGKPPMLFLAVFGGGLALAYCFYCLSISSAEELGEQQRTAFDLYRDRLLEQWPTVADIRDEKQAFGQIADFVLYDEHAGWEPAQRAHHARRTESGSQESA